MSKLPNTTYRPDLPTFGFTHSGGKGKEVCRTSRRPVPLDLSKLEPLGKRLWDDSARWELWHQGIPNAPEVPTAERIAAQVKHLAPNLLTRNEYVDIFTDELLTELTALVRDAA